MVDIAAGDTDGRDRLRDALRAPTSALSDTDVQRLWDQAVGACLPYVRPGYVTTAPEHLVGMVLAVAVHIHQATDNVPADTFPDGTAATPFTVTGNLVKRYLVLGGECVTGVKVAAGGTHTTGVLA